jgi:hypothetical protein
VNTITVEEVIMSYFEISNKSVIGNKILVVIDCIKEEEGLFLIHWHFKGDPQINESYTYYKAKGHITELGFNAICVKKLEEELQISADESDIDASSIDHLFDGIDTSLFAHMFDDTEDINHKAVVYDETKPCNRCHGYGMRRYMHIEKGRCFCCGAHPK